MIPTAIAMTAVHNHPIAHNPRDSVNCPITFGAIAMIMITATIMITAKVIIMTTITIITIIR